MRKQLLSRLIGLVAMSFVGIAVHAQTYVLAGNGSSNGLKATYTKMTDSGITMDSPNATGLYAAVAKFGDNAPVLYQLHSDNTKNYSDGKVMTVDSKSYKSIKFSNGAWQALVLPEGVVLEKMVFIGYSNGSSGTSYISNVTIKNGDEYKNVYTSDGNDVSLAYQSESSIANPDSITIDSLNLSGTVYFKNGGKQPCAIIKLYTRDAKSYTLKTEDTDFYGLYLPYETTIPSSVSAYTGTLNDDQTSLTLTQIKTDYIPAKEPVLVKSSEAGEFVFKESSNSAEASTTNSLKGVAAETTVTDLLGEVTDKTVLTLGMLSNEIGFRKPANDYIAANKVYLLVNSASAAKGVKIGFEEETTGINNVKTVGTANENVMFNLAGQRVNSTAKGLLIKNGKKFIVK